MEVATAAPVLVEVVVTTAKELLLQGHRRYQTTILLKALNKFSMAMLLLHRQMQLQQRQDRHTNGKMLPSFFLGSLPPLQPQLLLLLHHPHLA